jgi:hypothetical protein
MVNAETPVVVKAKVREGRLWKQVGPVERCSTDTVREETYRIETYIETLQSFGSEVAASITASTTVQGLVTEASMTATLSTSFKHGMSEMYAQTQSNEVKTTESRKAVMTYADWMIYRKYEITYGDETVGPWKPFNDEQCKALRPDPETYYVYLGLYRDAAELG